MDECDGYIPGENNGCLQFIDEWWDERGMNLCHNCGCEQRNFWQDETAELETEGYYV
jgi:oligoribonuclease (3'-5' exoribonuclease)